uniref:Uncharacterized protein n=1 Tax=Rhizophora mucronata TaxID=61149 RepID=A0A2P2Q8M3_RHIMU
MLTFRNANFDKHIKQKARIIMQCHL